MIDERAFLAQLESANTEELSQILRRRRASTDCTFSPELLGLTSEDYGDFTFGNVVTDSFDSIISKPKFVAVARDIAAGIHRCRETCEYFAYCGGGAPVNKYFENGSFDSTETMFCRLSTQAVLNVVLEKLEAKVASMTPETSSIGIQHE